MLNGKNSPTEEELMVLYQAGSEAAFRELYQRISGKVFGYLRARAQSEQEASDLFQEVFVKMHKSKHLYKPSLPVLPWVFSITYSVMIDSRRSFARKKEVFDFDLEHVPAAESPETELGDLSLLMEQLSTTQSAALQMRYADEKTFEEIAALLKTTPGNVRKLVSRALQNLKQLVKKGELK